MRALVHRLAPRRRLLKALGFDYDEYDRLRSGAQLGWLARRHRFRTLIDIGANDGTYAAQLRETLGVERVIAFEPQPQHADVLRGKGFEVHAVALGDTDGAASLRVNASDPSSSLLPVAPAHAAEWPHAAEVARIEVPLRRLDGCVRGDVETEVVVKIDAQGYEGAVIRGGVETIRRASAVLVEMSFVPMYEGAPLFNDVHAQLAALGLRLAGIRRQHRASATGEPLFAHCIYER